MTDDSLSPDSQPANLPASSAARTCRAISCVLPSYNERRNLECLLPVLIDLLSSLAPRWEIVIVDDGGSDGTVEYLRKRAFEGVRVVELTRNFGKEAAITAGLAAARGDVVALLDADLQHPPELIPKMLGLWRDGYDVVYAQRTSRASEPLFKRVGSRIFYLLLQSANRFTIPPGAGDFRIMDRKVVDSVLEFKEINRMMKGLFAWVGYRSIAVPYEPRERGHGSSTFRLRQLAQLSLAGITSFTTWPLRAVSIAGLIVAVAATAYGVYLVYDFVRHGSDIPGWTTLSVTLLLSTGLQLLALGVVGEYIGRIYREVKRRPVYLVREQFGNALGGRGTGLAPGGGGKDGAADGAGRSNAPGGGASGATASRATLPAPPAAPVPPAPSAPPSPPR